MRIKLKELPNTVVNTKTKEEFRGLMEIYEEAGWRRFGKKRPTDQECIGDWEMYREETCVEIEDRFAYGCREVFTEYGCKIISFQEFLEIQGLNSDDDYPYRIVIEEGSVINLETIRRFFDITNTKATTMNRTLKRVLNKNLRTLYKAKYIDGDLELTEKGKRVLFAILLEKYEEDLAKEAEEELKKEKENK